MPNSWRCRRRRGARRGARAAAETEFLDLDDPGIVADIDDPAAYRALAGGRYEGGPCKVGGPAAGGAAGGRLVAPYVTADQYGERLQASLERALGRRWNSATCTSACSGPGFSVDSVTIHEDPAIGIEPIVYINDGVGGSLTVRPSLWSLLGGRFVIASITPGYARASTSPRAGRPRSGAAGISPRW